MEVFHTTVLTFFLHPWTTKLSEVEDHHQKPNFSNPAHMASGPGGDAERAPPTHPQRRAAVREAAAKAALAREQHSAEQHEAHLLPFGDGDITAMRRDLR